MNGNSGGGGRRGDSPTPAARGAAKTSTTITASARSSVDIYRYGEHPEIPNPGDLLLVSNLEAAGHDGNIQFRLHIRGQDLSAFARVFADASIEYVQWAARGKPIWEPDPELVAIADQARETAARAAAEGAASRRSSRTRAS